MRRLTGSYKDDILVLADEDVIIEVIEASPQINQRVKILLKKVGLSTLPGVTRENLDHVSILSQSSSTSILNIMKL